MESGFRLIVYLRFKPIDFQVISLEFLRGIHITEMWEMRLYVAGETERSRHAIDNLKDICDIYLKDRCHIEVIDLRTHPEIAAKKEIFAIPTLVKELPPPVRKVIGDLHAIEKVLVGLDIARKTNSAG
jgi:circadian clock protein KaiB